jgi:hypothetical protein
MVAMSWNHDGLQPSSAANAGEAKIRDAGIPFRVPAEHLLPGLRC